MGFICLEAPRTRLLDGEEAKTQASGNFFPANILQNKFFTSAIRKYIFDSLAIL